MVGRVTKNFSASMVEEQQRGLLGAWKAQNHRLKKAQEVSSEFCVHPFHSIKYHLPCSQIPSLLKGDLTWHSNRG
jgi:hypothetical protein